MLIPAFVVGHLWVGDGEGAAATCAEPELAGFDDDDTAADVDAGDECEVAALATARLLPSPTPSAPVPTAVAMMIRLSLVFNVSASLRSGMILQAGHPDQLRPFCGETLRPICNGLASERVIALRITC